MNKQTGRQSRQDIKDPDLLDPPIDGPFGDHEILLSVPFL